MNDERCGRWLKAWIVLVALAAASLLIGSVWLAHAMDEGRHLRGEVISHGTTGGW